MRIAMNRDSSKKLNFHQSARPGGLRNIAQRVEQLCWIPESFHSFLRKSNWQNGTMAAVGVILKPEEMLKVLSRENETESE